MTGARVPGWYPDPAAPDDERYWDGSEWTQKRRFASFLGATPEHVLLGRGGRAKSRPNAFTADAPPAGRPRWPIVVAAIVLLIVVIWLFNRGDDDQPDITPDEFQSPFGLVDGIPG